MALVHRLVIRTLPPRVIESNNIIMNILQLILLSIITFVISSCALSQQEVLENIEKASSIARELAPIITKQK